MIGNIIWFLFFSWFDFKLSNLFAVIGSSFQGDAAIDDLRIFENPCVLTPQDADPSYFVPTTTSTKPSPVSPQGPYDCTFENGICNGWENMANNQFNWTRVRASTVAAPRMSQLVVYSSK